MVSIDMSDCNSIISNTYTHPHWHCCPCGDIVKVVHCQDHTTTENLFYSYNLPCLQTGLSDQTKNCWCRFWKLVNFQNLHVSSCGLFQNQNQVYSQVGLHLLAIWLSRPYIGPDVALMHMARAQMPYRILTVFVGIQKTCCNVQHRCFFSLNSILLEFGSGFIDDIILFKHFFQVKTKISTIFFILNTLVKGCK